jgi:hypothetical protein
MRARARGLVPAILLAAALAACGREAPRIPFAEASGEWIVMGFPRRGIAVDGPDGRALVIDRAIPISVAELRAGSVAVDIGGGATAPVAVAQLFYMPGADGDDPLDAWKASLPWRGYSDGSWTATAVRGVHRVELRLRRPDGSEDRHVYFAESDRIWSFEAPAPESKSP